MTDSQGAASWTAVVTEAMKNAPLYLGVILVLVWAGGQIPYFKVELPSERGYIIIVLGILLLSLGAYFAISDFRSRNGSAAKRPDIERYGITIDSHYDRQILDQTEFEITGKYRIWPSETHQLWLITKRDGFYSPQQLLETVGGTDRVWAVKYSTFRRDTWRTVGVYLVGENGQALIDTYFRCCAVIKKVNQHEPWSGIKLIGSDIVLCAERALFVR